MTNSYPLLTLKAGREASAGFQHPWIFSGALNEIPKDIPHGSLVHVADKQDKILGTGTYSATSSIAVRLFSFTQTTIDQTWLETKMRAALTKRQLLGFGPNTDTTGYRLIFSESDQIPGLIVDMYNDVAVIQISTAGTEQLKPLIVEALKAVMSPKAIIERSDIDVRKQENLELSTGTLFGSATESVAFQEHGLNFLADVINGQKTGFFLDQKNTRLSLARYSKDKTVLNMFSHTGANAVVALTNGATSVHNIDLSQEALDMIPKQLAANNVPIEKSTSQREDAFQWLGLKHEETYDIVITDPPALIKSKNQKEAAMKAYHFMNRSAMRLVKDKGIFITSSCSRYLTEEDLAFTLRRAAVQNNLRLELLQVIRQAEDHPLSIYFPESSYLKTFICQVLK